MNMSAIPMLEKPGLKYRIQTSRGDAIIPASDLPTFFEEAIQQTGFHKLGMINPSPTGEPGSKFFLRHSPSQMKAQLSVTGGINVGATTVAVTDLLREVGTVIDERNFLSTVPDLMSTAVEVIVDTVDRVKGVMADRKPDGSPFKTVQKRGFHSAAFKPGYFGEKMVISESDITNLRQFGTNNFSIRGVAQYLAFWTEQGHVRMFSKRNILLRQALFEGLYTWENTVFSFAVPTENTLLPLAAPWAELNTSGPYPRWVVNVNAKPLTDLRYYISQDPLLRRLKPFIRGVVMNRLTHSIFYQNPEVQQLTQYGWLANPSIVGSDSRGITMLETFQYLLGGDKNLQVHVDDSSYVADAEDPLGFDDNSTNYFLPDGVVMFMFDLASMGGQVADFVYTPALQNGGYTDARPGPYMAMEDLTAPGSAGGLENPSLKLIYGFNGMPRIKRPLDLFVLKAF